MRRRPARGIHVPLVVAASFLLSATTAVAPHPDGAGGEYHIPSLDLAVNPGPAALSVHHDARSAGESPLSPPIGLETTVGVQPGGVVRTETVACTLNFVFRGSDRRRYIGTAGHCVLDDVASHSHEEKTWAPGTGPAANDADGLRIGEFAYAIHEDPRDFALICLDPDVAASPAVAHFGGPTGTNDDRTENLLVLRYYGNGDGAGTLLPARSAIASGMRDPEHAYAVGLSGPGDSGSAVISSDGRAVGVLATGELKLPDGGEDESEVGTIGIPRLAPQLLGASRALGISLTLQTAPLRERNPSDDLPDQCPSSLELGPTLSMLRDGQGLSARRRPHEAGKIPMAELRETGDDAGAGRFWDHFYRRARGHQDDRLVGAASQDPSCGLEAVRRMGAEGLSRPLGRGHSPGKVICRSKSSMSAVIRSRMASR